MKRLRVVSAILTLFAGAPLVAQEGTITGTVTAVEGQTPVAGAQIRVVGTTLGALTREDGRYNILAPPGTYALRVVRIGFRPDSLANVVVAAGAATTANFTLAASVVRLGGVVVVGYGTQEARDRTGVVDRVTSAEFNTGRIVGPEQLIQGKVPGVQVISNNEPGGGTTVRVRGGTSVTSSNDPLFVVDGVPLVVGGGVSAGRNPLNFLNPNDIESMTVLKDASATAIYGSRGANGVVLVTTKAGSQGTQITYDVSASTSRIMREPDMLNAAQFRSAVAQYAPTFVDSIGNASTNWRDLIQRNGTGQEHNLAFSGGREDMRIRLSLGYLDQAGVIQATNAERLSAGLNFSDRVLNDRLEVRANLKGARTRDDFTPTDVIGSATRFAPTEPVRTSTGAYFEWANANGANNPISDLTLITDRGIQYRSVGDLETKYRAPFLEGLSATVRGGYDIARVERTTFNPSTAQGQLENSFGGTYTRNNPNQLNTLLEVFGNYTRQSERLQSDVDLTGGYTFEQFQYDSSRAFARGLSTDLLGPNGIPGADVQQSFLDVQESRLVSFFGRLNYTWRDKYLLTTSIRRDGSSRFGPGNQWGTFPSAAIAWRMKDEPFLENVGWLSELKPRLSWGINGNQSFANYLAYSSFEVGNTLAQVQFGDQFLSTIRPTAVDPKIKWEQTASTNVGLDYGFLDNRFSGSLDYYYKKTTDLLFNVPVAAGTNLSNFVTTNIGSLRNRGFEFGINAQIFRGQEGGFKWDASFNAATNNNRLLNISARGAGGEQILVGAIAGGVGNRIQVLQPGFPVNSFFVYQHKRVNGKPIYEDVNGDGTINEQDLYVDQNGDDVINQNDRRPYKSPAPKWTLAQSSQMSWRNFDLSYTMRAHLGNYAYNNAAANLGHYSTLRTGFPENLHASVLETGFVEAQFFSDVYVEDASFLRMDNFTVGYTLRGLPNVRQLRLYGTVQNVFTLTDYTGVDPEAAVVGFTTTVGIDNNIYPRSRTFLGGASFTF